MNLINAADCGIHPDMDVTENLYKLIDSIRNTDEEKIISCTKCNQVIVQK